MSDRKFQEGDVVAMNLVDSPLMTVENIGSNPNMVALVWFDAANVLHRDMLHKDCLQLVRATGSAA